MLGSLNTYFAAGKLRCVTAEAQLVDGERGGRTGRSAVVQQFQRTRVNTPLLLWLFYGCIRNICFQLFSRTNSHSFDFIDVCPTPFSAHGEDKNKVARSGVKPGPARKVAPPQPYKSKMGPQPQKPLNRIRAQNKGPRPRP